MLGSQGRLAGAVLLPAHPARAGRWDASSLLPQPARPWCSPRPWFPVRSRCVMGPQHGQRPSLLAQPRGLGPMQLGHLGC